MTALSYKTPQKNRSLAGYSNRDSYTIPLPNAAPTSANYVLAAIFSGPNAYVKVRRISIFNPGQVPSGAKVRFDLIRLTSYTSGGAAYTPQPYNPGNGGNILPPVFGGTVYTGNPTVVTTGTAIHVSSVFTPAAVAGFLPVITAWVDEIVQPPAIAPGAANTLGYAIRCVDGAASYANLDVLIEITEEEYLGS